VIDHRFPPENDAWLRCALTVSSSRDQPILLSDSHCSNAAAGDFEMAGRTKSPDDSADSSLAFDCDEGKPAAELDKRAN